MKRRYALLCLAFVACGGEAVQESNTGNNSAASGAGPNECPRGPLDDQVQALEGKSCVEEGMDCTSNNGCGGCSLTCRNGVWEPTDGGVCHFLGDTC